ncbi:MAG: hypothetical protein V9E94_04640 [Microthrixaceae bacterium]
MTPRLEEVAIILGSDGEPVVAPGLSEQPIGSNWPEDEAMSPYRFVGDGRASHRQRRGGDRPAVRRDRRGFGGRRDRGRRQG